jgi:hypothetical protein
MDLRDIHPLRLEAFRLPVPVIEQKAFRQGSDDKSKNCDLKKITDDFLSDVLLKIPNLSA